MAIATRIYRISVSNSETADCATLCAGSQAPTLTASPFPSTGPDLTRDPEPGPGMFRTFRRAQRGRARAR